jgi:hypothetical protein
MALQARDSDDHQLASEVPDDRAIARLDTGIPHIARVYDYVLGGYFR